SSKASCGVASITPSMPCQSAARRWRAQSVAPRRSRPRVSARRSQGPQRRQCMADSQGWRHVERTGVPSMTWGGAALELRALAARELRCDEIDSLFRRHHGSALESLQLAGDVRGFTGIDLLIDLDD